MTQAVCPLCGSNDNHYCFSERRHDLLACNACELLFIHPYGEDVHDKVVTYDYDHLTILDPAKHHASARAYLAQYLLDIEHECIGAHSILDVGCGTGTLLEMLGEKMPHLHRVGIELNAARAEFARTVTQCEVLQVPVETFEYDGTFDVITMTDLLSHVPSIHDLFATIRRLMPDDGRLILKVGEVTADVKKDAIFDWGIPDHLHFLGMNTLQFICNKYDFRIVRHDRQAFSVELFSRSRWTDPGRSTMRNFIKRIVAITPFALPVLRRLYDKRHGGTIFSSFVVLSPGRN